MTIDIPLIINIVFSIAGIIIFIVCEFIVLNILKLFPKAKMRTDWKVIFILVIFFISGYVVNIIALLLNISPILMFMQAFVYIFGAIFVLIVINLSYRTYKILIKTAENSN